MFHWNAVDTSPDLGGQNVLKTFEMAIRHKRQTTRTELETERQFSVAAFIFTHFQKYFSGPHTGGGGRLPPSHGSTTARSQETRRHLISQTARNLYCKL